MGHKGTEAWSHCPIGELGSCTDDCTLVFLQGLLHLSVPGMWSWCTVAVVCDQVFNGRTVPGLPACSGHHWWVQMVGEGAGDRRNMC